MMPGLFRSKRFWKRFAIGVALLVALLLIANGVLAWRSERQLQAKLAAIRASGQPASIAELAPEPIPEQENAAATLKRIEPRLDEFSKEYGHFYSTPLGEEYEALQDRGEAATPDQIDAVRNILRKYADVENALAQATERDKYASLLDYSLSADEFIEAVVNHQTTVRTAARFLAWRAEVALSDGNHEEAIQCGIEMLRLARLYENEPSLVSYLTAIAVRGVAFEPLYDALSAGPLSPKLHAALDKELERQDNPQRLKRALIMERAVGAGWFTTHLEQPYPFLLHITFGWMLKSYQAGTIDITNDYLQLADHPWHEVRAKFCPSDSPPPRSGHGIFADLLAPALRASFQAHARSVAVARALRVYNALRQFAETNGREAKGLEELDLPTEATIDPYSGQPLKLKHTDDGWVIYSVMENGVDDGGDFKELKDYGVAPPKWRTD